MPLDWNCSTTTTQRCVLSRRRQGSSNNIASTRPLCRFRYDRPHYVASLSALHIWGAQLDRIVSCKQKPVCSRRSASVFEYHLRAWWGSVIGPLLFLVYMLPVAWVVVSLEIDQTQYADDTQLYVGLKDNKSVPTADVDQLFPCHPPLSWQKLTVLDSRHDRSHRRRHRCTPTSWWTDPNSRHQEPSSFRRLKVFAVSESRFIKRFHSLNTLTACVNRHIFISELCVTSARKLREFLMTRPSWSHSHAPQSPRAVWTIL